MTRRPSPGGPEISTSTSRLAHSCTSGRGGTVPRFEAFQVVREQWVLRSHEIRDLLSRNSVPFGFRPVDSHQGRALLKGAGVTGEQLPVVVGFDGRVLVDPSNAE